MSDHGLERRAYYLLPDKPDPQVVQIVELATTTLRVVEPETGIEWTLQRAPFEERVRAGHAVRVEPQWEPAGRTVEV